MKMVQTPSGEWVEMETREWVHEDDPRIPTKEEGYVRFNVGPVPPKPPQSVNEDRLPEPTANETATHAAPELASENPASEQSSTSVVNPQPPLTALEVSSEAVPDVFVPIIESLETHMNNEPEYDEYEDQQEQEEGDDRPWKVTKQTLADIDEMSPSELEALIENIDANEEWRDLKETAKERTAQWLGAIRKADAAPRCEFLKTDGQVCRSPAMKGTTFCYFHGQARAQRQATDLSKLEDLPILEDRLSLQLAITRLCAQLTSRAIDEKTGRVLLAALRLAEKNLGDASTLYGPV